MVASPPAGFLEILEAEQRTDQKPYNVIGICMDYLPPAQSRGTDLTMKFQLWDISCQNSQDLAQDGMLVRNFYKQKHSFPRIEEVGDVLVAYQLKTLCKGSQTFSMSSHNTTWTVISGHSLQDSIDPDLRDVIIREPYTNPRAMQQRSAERPSLATLKYAKSLVAAKDLSRLRGPPKSTALDVATIMRENGGTPTTTARQKFSMIKDLRSPDSRHQFVDLVGEVRKVWSGNGNPVELQLTDYTEHPLLFNHSEEDSEGGPSKSWVGPWGQRTLTINAWDQHGQYIMDMVRSVEIDLGTYVRVNNVQIKMDKFGTLMQGHLRGGSGNTGTGITVYKVKEGGHIMELKDLIARRREYNVGRKSKAMGFDRASEVVRKRPAENETEHLETAPPNQKRRKSAKRRKQAPQSAAENTTSVMTKTNQHVRCEAINIPVTQISSIISPEILDRSTPIRNNAYRLPFQNTKYKSKVQVLDFFPDNLEDFATPYRISEYEALSDYESEDDEEVSIEYARHHTANVKWKWHFVLVVGDPQTARTRTPTGSGEQHSSAMLLQVTGQQGDYLLNMEACDLRSNPQNLARLKEKMFVLWGDLQEKKAECGKSGLELLREGVNASSKPFECLIKEYGVRARSERGEALQGHWERMFAIFGTNVG